MNGLMRREVGFIEGFRGVAKFPARDCASGKNPSIINKPRSINKNNKLQKRWQKHKRNL